MRRIIVLILFIFLISSVMPGMVAAERNIPETRYAYNQTASNNGFWNNYGFRYPIRWNADRPERLGDNVRHEVDPVVEDIIKTGMTYLGTPYVFGSNRNNPDTFDCSDFVRHIFKESADVTLPSNSRTQGAHVKELGNTVKRMSDLKRGDLMFFMSYKGSDRSDYAKFDKAKQRITHVGIYLGDGEILHTYSKASGGVRTDKIIGTSWEYRFLFGGSALE